MAHHFAEGLLADRIRLTERYLRVRPLPRARYAAAGARCEVELAGCGVWTAAVL